MMEVGRHPVFGIGLNDWTRPWWRAKMASFDNFWLLQAMRFGLPTLIFLALAWGSASCGSRRSGRFRPRRRTTGGAI